MSAPLIDESECSYLLPTPSASESEPSEEWVEEALESGIAPDERLYMPGRKWHVQRTLSRVVPTLLPTPNAWLGRRPENSTADPERAASRQHEGQKGKRSIELPDALAAEVTLLPTPTTQDAKNTGSPSQQERNTPPLNAVAPKLLPTPLTSDANDAAKTGEWSQLREVARDLLPTPTAQTGGDGQRPDGFRRLLAPELRRLLPTPTAQAAKHGATPDENANGYGYNLWDIPHLLPTPQAADGSGGRMEQKAMRNSGKRPSGQKATLTLGTAAALSGELTSRPFADGSRPSDGALPGQLTIEDA